MRKESVLNAQMGGVTVKLIKFKGNTWLPSITRLLKDSVILIIVPNVMGKVYALNVNPFTLYL